MPSPVGSSQTRRLQLELAALDEGPREVLSKLFVVGDLQSACEHPAPGLRPCAAAGAGRHRRRAS